MKLNALTQKEIAGLEPEELVKLLDILISNETSKYFTSAEIRQINVPLPITIKDGGEDARVELDLSSSVSRYHDSQWITSAYNMYQSKAQKMDSLACAKEVLKARKKPRDPKVLKPQVKKCIDAGGEYILFTTDSLVTGSIEARIKAIRKSFAECGETAVEKIKVKILDANLIARWANEHLAAVIYVQSCRGILRLEQFMVWSEWDRIFKAEKNYKYQLTGALESYNTQLFDFLDQDKIVRVVGHKGLGKTRFVLECFHPENSDARLSALSNSLVYINLATANPTELSSFILNYKETEGIIVVDNCSNEWHKNFEPVIKAGGNLKLITINDSPDDGSPNTLFLDRRMQKDAVRMIFQNCIPGLASNEIDYFVNISEGFPEMVKFIEKTIENNDTKAMIATIPQDFILKFLFAEAIDSAEYEMFKACSVFSAFSFYDDKVEDILSSGQKEKISAQNELIYTKIAKTPSNKINFYRFCTKYRDKRTLLEKNGLLHSVIPEPIAINLAAEWWMETSFELVYELFKELKDTELLIPMMDRLSTMDQVDRMRDIVAKAWGPGGPFSTAEVLNTELGSRLFRSVVEVNPKSTVEALVASFDEFDIEQLKTKVLPGRRNIVWALEKLVFRKESFVEAAKMLMRLSAAENENLGNNATGQLMQVFHIYLPGTEVDFEPRLEVIEWGCKHENLDIKKTAINAAGHGLKSSGFHRMGGAEKQGSGRLLQDYSPETWAEIFDYWKRIIDHLLAAVRNNPIELANLAKASIAGSIRSLAGHGQMSLVSMAIREVISNDPTLWPEAIKGLTQTLSWEKQMNETDTQLANDLLIILNPDTLKDKLRFIVSLPEWTYTGAMNQHELNAIAFGEEIIASGQNIIPYLASLQTGEQRAAYHFGVAMGRGSEVMALMDASLAALSNVTKEQQNIGFLAGLLSEQSKAVQREVMKKIIENKNLIDHLFYLIRMIEPTKEEIFSLFQLIDNGDLEINSFLGMQYGRALDPLGEEAVVELIEKILTYGIDGAWVSFSLLFNYSFQDENKWDAVKHLVRRIIMSYNNLSDVRITKRIDDYKWSVMQQKLLKGTMDEELAEHLSTQIIDAAATENFPVHDHTLTEPVEILCKEYFAIFWKHLAPVLLTNTLQWYKLKILLGTHNGSNGKLGDLFFGDLEEIFRWTKKNKPKGAYRIANMMPIYDGQSWSSFARRMIDEFGDDEKFLDEIAANMGSYSMVGNSKTYYERIISMASELLEHKLPGVRKWARNCINRYQKEIRREELDNEQRNWTGK